MADAGHDVSRLGFDVQQRGSVAGAGVGPQHQEQVGKPRHGHPAPGLRAVAPGRGQALPARALDVHRGQQLRRVEARSAHQRVDGPLTPVRRDDARGGEALDGLGDELHVGLRQRGVEVVGVDDALAAQRVGRAQFRAQGGVRYLALQVPRRCLEHAAPGHRAFVKAAPAPLQQVVPEGPHGPGVRRKARQQPVQGEVGPVHAWQHPVGGALEHVQLGSLLRQRRDELRGGGARADHRHALPLGGVGRVPAGRVQLAALEVVEPRDVRPTHLGQRAGAADKEAGEDLPMALGPLRVQRPPAFGVVKARGHDLHAQPQVRTQAVLVSAMRHVGLDLRRGCKALAPVRVGLEAEAVERRWHVHMRAGVSVVPPGAAHAGLLLQDEEVVQPGALELDAQAQPGHAGPQDHHVMHGRTAGTGVTGDGLGGAGRHEPIVATRGAL